MLAETDPELCQAVGSMLRHDQASDQRLQQFNGGVAELLRRVPADLRPDDSHVRGSTFAHFQILERVAAGGMGIVYRALDTRLGRAVALKFPQQQNGQDSDSATRKRFLREARSASVLDHPNLCPVYEAGETDAGLLYIAMPFYEGRTLSAILAEAAPLPVERALEIARQAAAGLACAHAAGIVHRDLKPGNLMVLPDGTVKVLDFGLATVADLSRTMSRSTAGTPAYMSPEQISGTNIDHRVDLWALGALLYEMTTGARPFQGENEWSTAQQVLNAEPRLPSSIRGEIPGAVEKLILRLLQKHPRDRYASAEAVLQDITAIQAGRVPNDLGMHVSPAQLDGAESNMSTGGAVRPQRTGMHAALAAAAVVVTIVVGVVYGVTARRPQGIMPDHSVAVLPFVSMSAESGTDYFSDGLSEQIISVLGRIPGLRVAARTSSFALRDAKLDIRTIGDTLNVKAVLEGSVRREGSQLRVTAQLIDASTGYHIWSGDYDRQMHEVVRVQDEIARDIARALELRLPIARTQSAGQRTPDLQAYDLYLRALYLRDNYTPEALQQARAYLDRAVELDPNFARAYALKATVLGSAIFWRYIPLEPSTAEMRAAIARALELDPGLGEAYGALGMLKLAFDRDFPAAERALLRAVELNQNDQFAWHVLGNYYSVTGKPIDEVAARARGVAIDPLNPRIGYTLAMAYVNAGMFPDALAQFERMLKLNAMDPIALGFGSGIPAGPSQVYLKQGRYREAVEDYKRVANLRGASREEVDSLHAAFQRGGMPAFWRSWLAFDLRHSGSNPHPVRVATYYALAGDTAQTLDWLERARAEQSIALIFVFANPAFASVREHARFRRIFQQLNFLAS